MPCWTNQPWPLNLNQPASGNPGAVHGSQASFSEAQLVADIATHFLQMTQVMIGEAIHVSELRAYLDELKRKGK